MRELGDLPMDWDAFRHAAVINALTTMTMTMKNQHSVKFEFIGIWNSCIRMQLLKVVILLKKSLFVL